MPIASLSARTGASPASTALRSFGRGDPVCFVRDPLQSVTGEQTNVALIDLGLLRRGGATSSWRLTCNFFRRNTAMETRTGKGTAIGGEQESRDAENRLSSAVERAQDTAARAADNIKDRARDVAEQQKQAGAEQMSGVADAMKAAADDLEEKIPFAAEYIDELAGRLTQVATTLRERSVDDVLANVADFARKQPATFFAGAVAAGFALSRFAKSSANREGNRND
jgi:acyl-CoA reductase-like NAD-dependent aldehyde dehydrogenase